MTHIEDILRVKNTPTEELSDYLSARIKALENRVEFLEAQVEVLNLIKWKQTNYLPVSTLIRQIVLKTIKNENKWKKTN